MHERIVLAQIGPFLLTAYGVCIAAGALLAVLMTVWLGTRRKQPLLTVLEVTLCGIAGAVLGARVLYCLAMIRPIAVDFGL